jgi:hypothetical protein
MIDMIYIIPILYSIMMNRINDSKKLWRGYNFCHE